MAEQLNHDTGLDFRPASNTFEAMANRDAAVEVSGALKTVAVSLSNIANNIRWLASGPRCGIGEIKIPELQPGSSIMPGKVNPVIPEAVMMVGAQVVGNDATIAWANALGSNFDLNVMMPVIAYNLLQSIDLLTGAAKHLAEKCVDAEKHLGGKSVARSDRDRGRRVALPRPDRAEPGHVHGPRPPDRLRRGGGGGEGGVQGRHQCPAGRARTGRRHVRSRRSSRASA